MFFVFYKNKVISYLIAASIVSILFIGSIFIAPSSDIEVVPASSKQIEEDYHNTTKNYIKTHWKAIKCLEIAK